MIGIIILHTLKNIKIVFFIGLLIKLFVLMTNLVNQLFFTEEKMQSIDLLKQFLKSMIIAKKIIKKHFNKNIFMSAKDGERLQLSNKRWICNKLFDVGDDKLRYHCHITGKYRESAHWSCNINLRLTKVPVIFHDLRGYAGHLTMQEIGTFDTKVNVIPNGLEKYMAFTINNNLVFIGGMQFMNSSLDALVKNFSDNDFNYLSEEFSDDLIELVKQKGVYLYEYIDSFKTFSEDKLPDKYEYFSFLKDECISETDYLHAINVWHVSKMNTIGDYHDLYLK